MRKSRFVTFPCGSMRCEDVTRKKVEFDLNKVEFLDASASEPLSIAYPTIYNHHRPE